MNIRGAFKTLFGREEQRSSPLWTPIDFSWSGETAITPRQAEGVPTVQAALSAISCGIASLPCLVYRRTPEGREEVGHHAFNRLVERGPVEAMDWFSFVQFLIRQCLVHGNALAAIESDEHGRLVGLTPVPWDNVSLRVLETGRMRFDITDPITNYGGRSRQRQLLADEVIFVRDMTDDAVIGVSRLVRAAGVIDAALAMQKFQAGFFKNGARPGGIIRHPGKLGDEAARRLKESWQANFSGGNAGKTAIFEEGMEYQALGATLEDSELVDARRFMTEEIARVFGVPLPLLNVWDHSSFTNSETASKWFATNTLAPWCKRLEGEFSRKLFSRESGLYVEFDMSGLLRGNDEERWKCWQIALQNNVLDPEEVRQAEGWNIRKSPQGDGDAPGPKHGDGTPAADPEK